jgi:spore coat polysaccharide biosynthesis protein SpsF
VRLVVVVQARVSSTRLPGKVLLPVAGAPMLVRMVERLRAARAPMEVAVATSTDSADDPIVALCRAIDVPCHRGHPTDLLARHLSCARERGADLCAKIPSDCPLIDPAVVDRVVAHWTDELDYLSNLHPPSYPDGNDVEIVPVELLALAAREAQRGFEREHTTPFFWERPGRFRLGNVAWEGGRDCSMSHRFTVDYPEDHRFVAAVFEELWSAERVFSLDDIMALLAARPDIKALNERYCGVNWYRHHLHELRTVGAESTRAAPLEVSS